MFQEYTFTPTTVRKLIPKTSPAFAKLNFLANRSVANGYEKKFHREAERHNLPGQVSKQLFIKDNGVILFRATTQMAQILQEAYPDLGIKQTCKS